MKTKRISAVLVKGATLYGALSRLEVLINGKTPQRLLNVGN
jgi:hypothetical protein